MKPARAPIARQHFSGEPVTTWPTVMEEHGKIIGVAVVKKKKKERERSRLEAMEERWQRARLEAFVSDENGIIILSSDPGRRLKSVVPLSDGEPGKTRPQPPVLLVPAERTAAAGPGKTLSKGARKLTFPANSELDSNQSDMSISCEPHP